MGGSMARKESRAPNGHPAELKKEGAVAFLSAIIILIRYITS